MTVDNILDLARTITHTNDVQVKPTQALQYANIIYQKVANRIISDIDEDFFWDSFLADTAIDRNEYKLQAASATTAWMKKVQRVEVKWASTDTYSSLVNSDTLSNYPTSIGDLNTNLSTEQAFYDIKDGSVFIYPQTTAVIAEWLKIQATVTLIDLVWGWAETTIFPTNQELREYHSIISVGMKQFIYAQQWLVNEKNDAINEFENDLTRMINTIKDRVQTPVVAELPNTSLSY